MRVQANPVQRFITEDKVVSGSGVTEKVSYVTMDLQESIVTGVNLSVFSGLKN